MKGASRSLPVSTAPAAVPSPAQQGRAFGADIDALRRRVEAQVGTEDLRRMRGVRAFSFGCEVLGRLLLHFSVHPAVWVAGVVALWVRKQLQVEIGHSILHGCFDKIDPSGRFHSARFRWDAPVEETTWRRGHNHDHHGHTNIVGRDPDIRFGKVRLADAAPYSSDARFGLFNDLLIWPWFFMSMTLHYSGLSDLYIRREGDFQYIDKKDWATVWRCHLVALKKLVPYWAYNFLLFPALAGDGFWYVLAGNLLADVLRDVVTSAAVHCGHIGVESFPRGTRTTSRAQWYERQVRATRNFQVPHWISVLVGGLNFQIEHHLFPRLPPNRLRQIAPEVREICLRHAVPYHSGSWWSVLKDAMGHIVRLSRPPAATG